MRPRLPCLAIVASLLLLAGCRGEPMFTPADLPRIVLQEDEAPAGTRRSSLSGASDLDGFARDERERDALQKDRFVAGYVAYFPPESYFLRQAGSPDDVSFQAIAGLFEAEDGASASLRRYVQDLRARQMRDASDVPSVGLGEESFGLFGSAAVDGSPLLIYAWRVRNLVLVLAASGPVERSDALALARTMDVRAA
jgi:hypothetical protein